MPKLNWPPYFQPHLDEEVTNSQNEARIPASLVDMFYLRNAPTAPSVLMIVVGCMGGDLDLFTEDNFQQLPEELQGQVQAVQASRRSSFRVITAQSLHLFTFESSEQAVQTAGLNDAVYLFGHMQLQISLGQNIIQQQRLHHSGRLTVGRLDLLHSFCESLGHVFTDPHNPNEEMYQLLVPAGPATDIRAGQSLVLLYPILQPQLFDRAHNSFMVMRLTYDLLSALQQDIKQTDPTHPFSQLTLPVPNRWQLERELEFDGYEIRDNMAVKRFFNAAPQPGQIQFLQRLRELTHSWLGPRVPLPPQASPEDYQAIIGSLFKEIMTPADTAMLAAMSGRVAAQPGEPLVEPKSVSSPAAAPTVKAAAVYNTTRPPATSQVASPATIVGQPKDTTPSQRQVEWAADFEVTILPPKPTDSEGWRQDFDMVDASAPDSESQSLGWNNDFEAQPDKSRERGKTSE